MKIYSRLTYFDVVLTTGRKLIPPILNNFTCWCSPKSNSWHIGMEGWLGEKGKNGVGLWCLCKEGHAGLNQNLAKQSSTSGHLSFWQKNFSFSHWSVFSWRRFVAVISSYQTEWTSLPCERVPPPKLRIAIFGKDRTNKYQTNIEQTLNKYWTNIEQISDKYQTNIKQLSKQVRLTPLWKPHQN